MTNFKHMKRYVRLLLAAVPLLLLTIILTWKLVLLKPAEVKEPEPAEVTAVPEPTAQTKDYVLDDDRLRSLRDELAEDQGINGDVQCLLHFNSGLIHDPVLQYTDDNYYLYKDWKTGDYLSYGSIVMDSRNDLSKDEMNTIIYGHYIYEFKNPDRTLVFTPLAQLMKEETWEENKYVSLVLSEEVRYYEIVSVYECPLETVDGGQYALYGLEYNLIDYDTEYMALYKENINTHEYYHLNKEYGVEDHFLTLQTCIEGNENAREIVLCRELERVPFTD